MDDVQPVPPDVRETGLNWCQRCLTGRWSKLHDKDFNIRILRGGLSNHLYVCSLSHDIPVEDGEPQEVLLRIYGDVISSTSEFLMHNCVISALLAERKLSPQIYGLFATGRLEEFMHAKTLQTNDIHQPEMSAMIASKMAEIHALNMPLSKQPDQVYVIMNRMLSEIKKNIAKQEHADARINTLIAYNLPDEFHNMRKIFSHVPSPVVFCHNDLQEGNIMYSEEAEGMDKITFIDFEYGMYNNRGFDFGNHFNEWTLDYSYEKPPYFKCIKQNYPNKDQQKLYFRAYLSAQGRTDVSESELDDMCLETDTFSLGSHFLLGLWGFAMAFSSSIKFDYLAYALTRFDSYFERKRDICQRLGLKNNLWS